MRIKSKNDPISGVIQAVQELYPDLEADIWYDDTMEFKGEDRICGETVFPLDGTTPIIRINARIPFYAVPEIIAHELAHVKEPEDVNHGEKWEKAFNAIFMQYSKNMKQILKQKGDVE